jgi:predicted naringenin-chalcone synthase
MPSYIQNISTVVPDTSYNQDYLREQMKTYVADDRRLEHLIHRIYSHSGIEKRHTVVDDFTRSNGTPFYFQQDQTVTSPSTGDRNQAFTDHATPLLHQTGKQLLDEAAGIEPEDITHVITVSCTGFFAPGPDLSVVRQLDLPKNTRLFNL